MLSVTETSQSMGTDTKNMENINLDNFINFSPTMSFKFVILKADQKILHLIFLIRQICLSSVAKVKDFLKNNIGHFEVKNDMNRGKYTD